MKEMAENMEVLIDQIEDYAILMKNYIFEDYSLFDYEDEEDLNWEVASVINDLFETFLIIRELIENR